MHYNNMYEVYRELSAKHPEVTLDYDSSYDSINYVTENYEVTALSNYNQPFLSIKKPNEQYQYSTGNFEDTFKFISELISGNISMSYDEFSNAKRLKIDGWTNTQKLRKENFLGKIPLLIGIFLMLLGAVFSIVNFTMFFDGTDTFLGNLTPMPFWIALFIAGLYMVINCNKITLLDALGYLAGVSVTAFPMAVLISMLDSSDISFPAAAGLSGVFWFVGRIIRKNCKKHIDKADDIYLDQLPGPVYGNQNNNGNDFYQ